jgi:DNA-binding transcriptional regulator LsrR (DeoR family)
VRERLPQLKKCGAIGEILGTFLDERGIPIAHELNDTVIAMSPADLKKVPNSLLVSGGLYKAEIIRAILVSGYVNRLVTDEAVARRLLERV